MNKLIVAAIIAAVSAGAGWTARDWKADAAASSVAEAHATALAKANGETLALQKTLNKERDAKALEFKEIDTRNIEQLRIAQNETNRLRTCIANGTCGLRVNVVRTEPASKLPGTADPVSVGDGTGTRLTPDAEQNYFALREGITRLQTKLQTLQQSFRVLDAERAK